MSNRLAAIPYARLLGVRLEPTDAGWNLVLPFAEHIVGNPSPPRIHGGVIGAVLELTAMLCVVGEGGGRAARPINFNVDFLRSAHPRDTRACVATYKLGKRIAHVRVVAWQADRDKPVAAGSAKFLVQ